MGISLGTIATIASIAGTAVGVVGSIVQGQQQAAAARYQAQVARNNALSAEYAAQNEKRKAEVDAANKAMQIRQARGAQITALASSGVDVGSDSAVDLQGDTVKAGTLDINTIRNNAAIRAQQLREEGANYTADAGLYDSSAKNAVTAGYWNAASTAVSGLGAVADKWYSYSSPSTPTDSTRTSGALNRTAVIGGLTAGGIAY